MKINKLLRKLNYSIKFKNNHKVSDCYNNSKLSIQNSIYIAIKGSNNDGHKFIEEAIKNGAKTIIHQEDVKEYNKDINYLRVDNSKKMYALVLKILNKDISKKMYLIGITGTNGKTTSTSIINSFLEFMGHKTLYMGTHFIKNDQKRYKTINTTPDIKVIYEHLKLARKNKIKYVIMEVSSISVSELRIMGLTYRILGVTNLNLDHLDYHKTFEDYKYAKLLSIFNLSQKSHLILNKDEDSFELFNNHYFQKTVTYSLEDKFSDYNLKIIKNTIEGSKFSINNFEFQTSLLGKYNLYNIALVYSVIMQLGYNDIQYKTFLANYKEVSGRSNIFRYENKVIIVDYAHTPFAVENVLKTVKSLNYKNITVIIGAGGNRDKQKRQIMGNVVNKYASKIILTNDNPRNEDELSIIKDIAKGIDKKYIIELSSRKAITRAINESVENEVICILGKGNENTQIFKNRQINFNDIEVVKEIIGG